MFDPAVLNATSSLLIRSRAGRDPRPDIRRGATLAVARHALALASMLDETSSHLDRRHDRYPAERREQHLLRVAVSSSTPLGTNDQEVDVTDSTQSPERPPAVVWSWPHALIGVVYAIPAAAVALRDPSSGIPLA